MLVKRLEKNKQDIHDFVKFPFSIYEDNPNWVPPVIDDEVEHLLDENSLENKNEFAYFMVYDGKIARARIAAGIDKSFNEKNKTKRGYISYYECAENPVASKEALDAAIAYLKTLGILEVVATKSTTFSNFGKGILVNGFDDSTKLIRPYNHPYYEEYLKSYGFKPYKHHDTYWIKANNFPLDEFTALSEKAMLRFKFRTEIVPLFKNTIPQLAERIISVIHQSYNADWETSQPSADDIIRELKCIYKFAKNNYIVIAYSDERPIGAFVGYSDFNKNLKKYNGKLFPKYYLDKFLNTETPNISHSSMIFVVPDFQHKAVDVAMMCEAFRKLKNDGIELIEATTIPSSNKQFVSTIKRLGGINTRSYGQFLMEI